MLQKYSVVMVESPFLTGGIPADAGPPSVHAFAEHYTEALAAQLDSNFKVVTAGFSMGGFLAFEVASGLQNKGFEINRVINIDQPLATAMQKASLPQRALNWLYRFRSPGVALDDLVTVAKKKLIRSVGVTALNDAMASDMLKSIELEEFYVRGDNDYRPRPADLSLHLIRGGGFEAKYILSEDSGWSKFVTRLQSHRMFGTHSTLFAAANFSKLLELFNQALESKE